MKRNIVDEAIFQVKAGDGGRGAISFRREKFVPKGGPDGGHGGDGGSIWLEADEDIATLKYFAGKDRFAAEGGEPGSKRKRSGEDAEDMVLKVPVGTVVWLSPEDYDLGQLMDLHGRDWQLEQIEYQRPVGMESFEERWVLQQETGNRRQETGKAEWVAVGELTEDGQRMLLARGGQGGRGNTAFKSSRITTPWFAETGTGGERWRVRLELKVLADVGLVGLPNVGKSTLLSVLTAAKPEVADYPFTTLSPNLGVMQSTEIPDRLASNPSASSGQDSRQAVPAKGRAGEDDTDGMESLPPVSKKASLIIADIPGLIEKAHEGKGLGDAFLRHVERCQLLLYVVAPLYERGFEASMSGEAVAEDLWEQYATVREEVRLYRANLEDKPGMVVVNKLDLMSEMQVEAVKAFFQEKLSAKPLIVSAATTEGVEELKGVISGP